MQHENILRTTYQKVVAEALETARDALSYSYVITETVTPKPIKVARTSWRVGEASLEAIDKTLDDVTASILAIRANGDFTFEAKSARMTELRRAAETAIEVHRSTVTDRIESVLGGLRGASYPPRPEPRDAAQEAAIAGIKADTQLALSSVEDGYSTIHQMRRRLERAMGDGDDLAAWVLASSRWPEDYLTSRRLDFVEAWQEEVASVLDQNLPPDLKEVRVAFNRVNNGQKGLPSIEVAMNSLLPQILADLGQ